MKRLLTYLGLLATLLAMPYHAKADNWAYYLHGSFDKWANNPSYYFGDTSSDKSDISWGKTISGSTLLTNAEGTNVRFKVWIKYTGNNSSNYDLGAIDGDNTEITLGTPCEISSGKGGNAILLKNVQANHNYRFTFVPYEGRNTGKITVIDEGKIEEKIELLTDAYKDGGNWIGISYNEYNSTTDTYTWYLSSINGFTNNSSEFKLKINDTWFGGNGSNIETIGTGWSTLTSPGQNCKASYSAPSSGKAIRLEVTKDGNNWKAHIVEGDGPHDYYWVSPQITNGEMWPAFKMVASRNRYWSGSKVIGDGLISTKYYTFTIKDDDLVRWRTKNKIENGQTIRWYILRDDGKVVYRPVSDLNPGDLPHSGNPYDDKHPISGDLDDYVSYINFWNGSSYDGEKAYMTSAEPYNTGSWAFSKGSAKAHTFNLNAEKGHVLYNYTNKGALTNKGYNLVGNWTADTKASIKLAQGKPMKKYCFKGGVGELIDDNKVVADADSIVYKIDITKKELNINSWGGLYLDISPSDNGTLDNDTNWGKVFRPLITIGNNLDGRALHGALTTKKDEQSLNPETSENYLGYTFSFNATTMTYRLEFHTPDATLKPGTEDGNLNFLNSTSETINVNFSNASDGIHTTATKYQIAFGDYSEDITINSDTPTSTASSFKLRYDGTNIYKDDETTPVATGKTVFVKIKGWDDDNNYGDVHTYQYTFYSPLTFEPKGGLFINSAKIKIQGGAKPYTWRVYKYETKKDEVSGDDVLDLHTVLSSGTFDGDYNDTDGNYRISTPGILEIEDKNGKKVISDEKNLFDFTYSTSENYDIQKNGADYWNAAPGDLSNKLDLTWGGKTLIDETSVVDWTGKVVPKRVDSPLTQTIEGLNADKTYTVQAIVRGLGENKKTVTLTLEGEKTVTKTLNLRNGSGGNENSADLSRQGSEVTKTGRIEYIEPLVFESAGYKYKEDDNYYKNPGSGWAKVEATVNASQDGKLTIKLQGDEWFDLSNVTLLEDANTDHGFRTTASATALSTGDSEETHTFDYRARDISRGWKKNNAYSFFDRGKNRNAVIFANDRTVIAMNPDHLADVPQNEELKAVDRRHPFNVVGSDEDDTKIGTAKALYLTDMGYGDDKENPVDYKIGDSTWLTYNSTNYRKSGYTFKPYLSFYAEDVILDRTPGVSEKKQTTIMLPFGISVDEMKEYYGDELRVWDYQSYNANTITFSEVKDNLTANKPYILTGANGMLDSRGKNKAKKTVAQVVNTIHHTASNHEGFTGTYEYKVIERSAEGETRYGYNPTSGKFQIAAAAGASLKPFRAYFTLPVVFDQTTSARELTVIFDDVITGISESVQVNVEPTNVYTLGGVLVARNGDLSRLPKGVYIVNGKKVIK